MELNELLDAIEFNSRIGNINKLESLKQELLKYTDSCMENEKNICQLYLSTINNNINVLKARDRFTCQKEKLKYFINSWDNNDLMKVEYSEPYGKKVGVDILIGNFLIATMFNGKELQTYFYLATIAPVKQFVLKKKIPENTYDILQKFKGDHYSKNATYDNWADLIINHIRAIEEDSNKFVTMCKTSCPFNEDGTHKYKEWKTLAKVEISYEDNTGVVQGLKKGETLSGAHVYGGNGSYRYVNPRNYVLKYTVDSIACEIPKRHTYMIDADAYLRGLLERMGRSRMPYDMLNSKLNTKIAVITRDMNKSPEDRTFYPVDYNYDWIEFLNQAFKDL